MAVNQLSVFIENRTGKLVECTEVLAQQKIDIRAMSIADTQDFGILRLIVNDSESAEKALREKGFIVAQNQVVCVAIEDTPGSLSKVVRLLSDNGINIEYMYAFLTVTKQYAYVVLRVLDNDKTTALLNSNGVKTISTQDVEKL